MLGPPEANVARTDEAAATTCAYSPSPCCVQYLSNAFPSQLTSPPLWSPATASALDSILEVEAGEREGRRTAPADEAACSQKEVLCYAEDAVVNAIRAHLTSAAEEAEANERGLSAFTEAALELKCSLLLSSLDRASRR